jgi:hypothetical protein
VDSILKPHSPWESHDWKIKTLEALLNGGGSRLGFTCRACERTFGYLTSNGRAWAVNAEWAALTDEVSLRWLRENCPVRPPARDDEDRKALKNR